MDEGAKAAGLLSPRQTMGLWLGLVASGLALLVGPPQSLVVFAGDAQAAVSAWRVFALVLLMAIWWVSEAIPIPVTALLPMIWLPLSGVMSIRSAAAEFMHPVVVLLMGGFIVAKAIERWNLHTRIALNIVARVGNKPGRIIGGFMLACALLSMWISNTATSIMMMPIAISVAIAILGRDKIDAPFTLALLLGIAYACSIGGLGTLIGTPTNLLIQGYLNDVAGLSINFVDWMKLGVPAVIVLLPLAWFVLTQWAFKLETTEGGSAQDVIGAHLRELGPMSTPEKRTLLVFAIVAGLWVLGGPLKTVDVGAVFGMDAFVPFAGLTDHIVAIIGVVLCFLVPAGSGRKGETVLNWKTAESIPWGVVLLFGGGMSLAAALTQSGLGGWMGSELTALATLPVILLMLIVTTVVIFSTEITSNVATAAALMPVLGAVALATGIPPELIGAPLALAASCAFMLPMATGPNAVVYATGHVTVGQMASAGLRLNLVAIVAITALTYWLAPIAFRAAG